MVEILKNSITALRAYLLQAYLLLLLFSCGEQEEEKLFTLLPASETGIDFSNDLTSTVDMNILEYLYFYNGGGVALGDINNDGLIDIYFASNQGENKLYLNKGDFQFEDITAQAGVDGGGGWSTGVTMADVNGDGLLDIYVCQVGDYKGINGKNKLYINNGDLTFSEQAESYGIAFEGFSTHALFFDYDQDGDLDLYLLNHSIKKPEVFSHADTKFEDQDEKGGDKLYQSQLAQGATKMIEVTEEAGILSSSLGFGLGVGIGDVNGDGWLDIYVSNDFTEDDYLYLNQGDGTFKESLQTMISHTSRYSMGNDINDLNNDGFPEIFTTDMLPEDPVIWMKSIGEDKQEVYDIKKRFGYGDQYVRNHLQLNMQGERFSDIALLTETFATDWSWSPLIFDMDNDGQKDIHVTNGIVKRPNDLDFVQYSQSPNAALSEKELYEKLVSMLPTMKLANYAFQQTDYLTFENKAKAWGLDQLSYGSGSAYGDLNNDGAVDLVVNNIDQVASIYRNNTQEMLKHHFFQVDLEGDAQNLFGLGAHVQIQTASGMQHQLLSTSRGFQSGPAPTIHFGLGNENKIEEVQVRWSSDFIESFGPFDSNQKVKLKKGSGKRVLKEAKEQLKSFEQVEVGLDWSHAENLEFDDMRREYLIPRKYSTEGPALAVGDVNGDGLEDIYLGGAKGQAGALYLQLKDGTFQKKEQALFEQMKPGEDVVAEFVDLNGNGHLDLYVGSGGYENPQGHVFNFDRVYFNDGNGNFSFSPNALPPLGENTSSIAIHDINGDGAPDIFIGSAAVTGNYGAEPYSYLLINDGRGFFTDQTKKYFGEAPAFGMLQAAIWQDTDADGQKELVLTGEWGEVQIWKQEMDQYFSKIPNRSPRGMYLSALPITWNGQSAVLLGNMGTNQKWKASEKKPLWLYHADFDGNGQEDPLIFHYMGEKLLPFATRDDLVKQIPAIKKLHGNYLEYAQINNPSGILNSKQIEEARKLSVENLESGIYIYGDDNFIPLRIEGQFAPIQAAYVWENHGTTHLLTVGGFYGYRNDLGRADAMPMAHFVLEQGVFKFKSLPLGQIGGEYRQLKPIMIKNQLHLIALRNNDSPIVLKL